MEINPAPLDTAEVLDGLERSFRPVAEEKGLELVRRGRRRAARRSSPTTSASPQILRNLLSNAVKFTDSGSVTLARRPDDRARPPRRAVRARVHGHRHRHRHPAGQAAADLRGLPAGRRDHQPPLRRHRPRPVDQPRDRAPARRRDPRRLSTEGEGSTFTLLLPADAAAAARARRRSNREPAYADAAPGAGRRAASPTRSATTASRSPRATASC